ncbi:hypothetical protein THAOC_20332 [Thalassiosira oceanica]|uniref:Uncharacterized protein n=1 Tax=Thalassiosira oceanica TaxID=159749 RepID=K0S013_THAOC|nr:hypothetical protein THAOC_20332 [Thalassiosira oceanica]|eukprot:EJK59448.1 hypothetical protein THAOC_20332 [Thalassiosira oceanica]
MAMGRRTGTAATADESESALFDHHHDATPLFGGEKSAAATTTLDDQEALDWAAFNQAMAAAGEKEDRWTEYYEAEEDRWTEQFFEALLAAGQSEERGDVTAAAGASEAVNEVAATPSGLGRHHEADQPVSEPKSAPADPVDQDVEEVPPITPVSPPAPDVAQQLLQPSSGIPGDASVGERAPAQKSDSTAIRNFEIGLAVTTASALASLAVFVAVKTRTALRRKKERDIATAKRKEKKRRREKRRTREETGGTPLRP